MVNPDKKPAPSSSSSSKLPMIILAVVGLILAFTIKMSFLFLMLFILPAFVVYIVDRSPRHHLFKSVAACNLTGILPYLSDLAATGHSSSEVWMLIKDPIVWFKIYAIAGMGWLLVSASPYLAQFLMIMASRNRVLYLESTQKRLLDEWGPEIDKREKNGDKKDDAKEKKEDE